MLIIGDLYGVGEVSARKAGRHVTEYMERLRENLADFREKKIKFVPESFRWTVYMSRLGTKFSISENISFSNRPIFPANALYIRSRVCPLFGRTRDQLRTKRLQSTCQKGAWVASLHCTEGRTVNSVRFWLVSPHGGLQRFRDPWI